MSAMELDNTGDSDFEFNVTRVGANPRARITPKVAAKPKKQTKKRVKKPIIKEVLEVEAAKTVIKSSSFVVAFVGGVISFVLWNLL